MSNGQVDLGKLKFPLWSPATKALSILVVIAAGFIIYTRFIKPEFVDPDTLPMPTSEVMQLKEIALHFTEDPCRELALDDVGEVEHYCSDDCVATFYDWQGRRVPKINFHPRRLLELEMEVEAAGFLGVWQKDCGCPELDCLPPWARLTTGRSSTWRTSAWSGSFGSSPTAAGSTSGSTVAPRSGSTPSRTGTAAYTGSRSDAQSPSHCLM